MNSTKIIYITIIGICFFACTPQVNAAGLSFEQCMEQYGVASYCKQYGSSDESGGESSEGRNVDSKYAEEADQMRSEGIQIFRKAGEKTHDPRFAQLADALENVKFLPGSESECNNAHSAGSTVLAYTEASENTEYYCQRPSMDTILHETVHIVQGPGGENKEVECDADNYMIKALYYGAGRIQVGNYDYDENNRPYCPQNIALERSLRSK